MRTYYEHIRDLFYYVLNEYHLRSLDPKLQYTADRLNVVTEPIWVQELVIEGLAISKVVEKSTVQIAVSLDRNYNWKLGDVLIMSDSFYWIFPFDYRLGPHNPRILAKFAELIAAFVLHYRNKKSWIMLNEPPKSSYFTSHISFPALFIPDKLNSPPDLIDRKQKPQHIVDLINQISLMLH